MSPTHASLVRWILPVALAWCLVSRVLIWPAENEFRDIDELAYVQGGLHAVEGFQPSMRHTPNGPQTWLTAAYASAAIAGEVARPSADGSQSGLLRLPQAADRALFRLYADSTALRDLHLFAQTVIALATAVLVWRWGRQRAGIAGGIALVGLYLLAPVFLRYGVLGNPYFAGWSFGLMAMALANTAASPLLSAACFGFAVASRLEMGALLPFLCLELPGKPRAQALAVWGLVSAGVFALAAPWFIAGLVSGIRNLVTVGILHSGRMPGERAWRLLLAEGWLPFIAAATVGALAGNRNRRARTVFTLLALAVLLLSRPRETRYAVVWLVALTPAFLALFVWLREKRPALTPAAVALALAWPAVATFGAIRSIRADRVADHSSEWIVRHVPAGTRVAFMPSFRTPLPTVDSGERLWNDVRRTDAWKTKVAEAMTRLHLDAASWPRALNEESINLDMMNRRRWWILSGNHGPSQPRYDLRLDDSLAFGVDTLEEFRRGGGCLVLRGEAMPEFGEPAFAERAPSGRGVFVYLRLSSP